MSSVTELAPGTLIETVEQFDALPMGTEVVLDYAQGQAETWRRADGGWVKIAVGSTLMPSRQPSVESRHFVGTVAAGLIRVAGGPPPFADLVVGEWITFNNRRYQVLVAEPDRWLVARYWRGRFMAYAWLDRGELESNPDSLDRAQEAVAEAVPAAVLLNAWSDVRNNHVPPAPTPEPVQVIPPLLVTDLHEWADGAVATSDFEDLLDRHGIGRRVGVSVQVSLAGMSYVTMGERAAAAQLGLDVDQITEVYDTCAVRWRKTFAVTRMVAPNRCACESVSDADDDVTSEAPAGADSWEVSGTSCDNDDD